MNRFDVRLRAALILATAVGGAGPTLAQSQAEISRAVTDGAQIEAAIARNDAARPSEEDDQAIDGEAGVYVLRKADIFFVGGEAGISYSQNPLRTVDDIGGSWASEARLDLGVQTLIVEKVNFTAALNFSDTRFFSDFAPSNSLASGNMSVSTGLGKTPLFVGVGAFGGWNFDRNLEAATGFYGASAHIGATVSIDQRTIFQPLLVISRVKNEVSENDNTSLALRLNMARRIGHLTISANAVAARFWFDDFFEDVTFVARNDWQYEGGIAAAYAISPSFQVVASARYTRRDSSFFLSSFESVEAGAGLAAIWRF